MKDKIFEFIKKTQAIAHTGVTYSECPYALDNYHELLEESSKMLHEYIKSDVQPYDIYKGVMYPTPQPGVRVVIVEGDKILMTQDVDVPSDEWTIPGGWCDVDTSPVEASIKEVKEETGFDIKVTKLLALMDRNKYIESSVYNVYSIVFLAEIIGGSNNPNFEVNKAKFFDIGDLPKLSNKLSREEIDVILEAYRTGEIYFE